MYMRFHGPLRCGGRRTEERLMVIDLSESVSLGVSLLSVDGACAKGGRLPDRKTTIPVAESVSNALLVLLKGCYFDGGFLIILRMISQQQETCHEDGGGVSWYENGRCQKMNN